ncbi:MAG: MATE family efflux transporter [Emergencia timonensis]|uniref:MATE family efflux transporter n=1 Tax=Emergencia timonensis TaxID=1776384 RepID=UPI000B19886B|nr:MATE family efflux transporter [Emergencia timonensis]WNX87617.1 MATE family efflux transporter [Emergencia timonensis]
MKNNTLMTSGTIWKEILLFSIPLILGNLFQQLYNIVDSIIVGNVVGSSALAAVGASGAIIQLLVGFCIGASAGAGVVTSQYYGARDDEGVRKAVHTTIAISIAAGAILSIIGVLTAPLILDIMGTPEEVFDQASDYLRVFFAGIIFSVIYNMSAGILNAVGNSRRSLIYLIIAAVSNIFLDILFVAVFKMGVVGAAIATDISQLISCIFILRFMRRSKESYRIRLRDVRFYDNLLGKIVKIGLPTGVQNIVISLSNVVVQSGVNSFGATVMASYAAFNKIDGFILLPILSMSMAATTFAGQNYGAREFDRVHKGMKVSIGMGAVYAVVAGALMLIFAPYIIRIFTGEQAVIDYGIYMMKYMYPFYWIIAIFHIATGTIRGVGKTLQAMIMSICSLCAVRILWIWGSFQFAHKLYLLLLGYPITWVIGAIMMLIYIKKGKWLEDPEAAEQKES